MKKKYFEIKKKHIRVDNDSEKSDEYLKCKSLSEKSKWLK